MLTSGKKSNRTMVTLMDKREIKPMKITIDLSTYFADLAKLEQLPDYKVRAIDEAGEGAEVLLTGAAPVWLYLSIAHAVHGKAKKLSYSSPVTGEVIIFDHNPF